VFSCWRRGWCGEGGCGSSDQRGDQKGFQFGKGRSAFIDAGAWQPPVCASLAGALDGREGPSAAFAALARKETMEKGRWAPKLQRHALALLLHHGGRSSAAAMSAEGKLLHPHRRRPVQRCVGVAAAAACRPRITSDDAARARRRARWTPDLPETTHPRRLTCRPQTLCNGAERRRKFYRSCLMRQIVELRCPRRPWNAPLPETRCASAFVGHRPGRTQTNKETKIIARTKTCWKTGRQEGATRRPQ
jgi:hypothetical protein